MLVFVLSILGAARVEAFVSAYLQTGEIETTPTVNYISSNWVKTNKPCKVYKRVTHTHYVYMPEDYMCAPISSHTHRLITLGPATPATGLSALVIVFMTTERALSHRVDATIDSIFGRLCRR